jgi:carbon monoxide dehydrogenase subunit G
MGHISRSASVACQPDRVFDVLTDVDRLKEFSEMTVEVRGPGRPVQPGDRFEQVVRVLGKDLETEWEVVEVERPHRLRFTGTGPAGAHATLTETLEPEGDGTRVELDAEYDLPLGILGDAVDALFLERKNGEAAEAILAKLASLCQRSA